MHLFRVRLILALIVGVTLVSVASTYFDVLAHRHILREELERRAKWMGMSIQPDVQERAQDGRCFCSARIDGALEDRNGRTGTGGV